MGTKRKEFKTIITLAIPVIIGQLGQIAMSVTDTIMVGDLGKTSLAAAALGNSLFGIIMMVGIGFSMAITPLVGMSKSSGEQEECGRLLRQGVLATLLVGALLFLITWVVAMLIPWFRQPAEIVPSSMEYLKILGWSLFPIMIFQSYRQFAEGLSLMKPAMIITLIAVLFNAFANWVLIFGNLGFPALELTGAGYATLSSRIFMAIALALLISYSSKVAVYRPNLHFRSIDWGLIRKIISLGIPISGQFFFEVSAFSMVAVFAGWLGTEELAAHQVALNLVSITYMVLVGIAATATVRVANGAGQENPIMVRRSGLVAILAASGVAIFFGSYYVLFRDFLPTFYSTDQQVINLAASLLLIAALFQFSDGIQAVALGALRGLTDVKVPTGIAFFAYWLFGIPVGYFLAFHQNFGIAGIWWGLLIGLTLSAFMLTFRFYRQSQKLVIAFH